jgi:hypothetical protein
MTCQQSTQEAVHVDKRQTTITTLLFAVPVTIDFRNLLKLFKVRVDKHSMQRYYVHLGCGQRRVPAGGGSRQTQKVRCLGDFHFFRICLHKTRSYGTVALRHESSGELNDVDIRVPSCLRKI